MDCGSTADTRVLAMALGDDAGQAHSLPSSLADVSKSGPDPRRSLRIRSVTHGLHEGRRVYGRCWLRCSLRVSPVITVHSAAPDIMIRLRFHDGEEMGPRCWPECDAHGITQRS